MKHYKLPFNIQLQRKYNEINIDSFLNDWEIEKKSRKVRSVIMHNDLHMEIGKFKTYDLEVSQIIDLGMRYAFGKLEFRKLAAELINNKNK